MNRLIEFFIERFVFAISIFTAIIFFGLISATSLGIDLLPEFEFPIVGINTTYSGAGSEEMAEQITQPIEDAIATLPGVTDITSFSGEGFSFVIAQFSFDVDVNQAAVEVNQRVNTIVDALPDDAETPTIQKFDPADEPILNIALTAPGADLAEVQRYAEEVLEPLLQRVEGVADIAVRGPISREVQVLLDPSKLELYNLTPQQVAGAIGASSITLPAGSLTLTDERVLIAMRTVPETANEIETMLADSAQGVTISDVAVVRDTSAEPQSFVRLNNNPAILLEVRKVSGTNSVASADNVRAAVDDLTLPPNYEATFVGDTTVFIANSVNDTFRETLMAVAAVALVVLLFVGRLGSTFSVVLAIPITILGATIGFGLLGYTFNTVTLLAITVAVGLVVDDSIVIAENTDRYVEMGYSRKEAVLRGAGEVSVAVLTATLSLLAVFIPIALLPGVVGQFFAQFGLVLAATIVVSYLEALFFLTVRLAYMPNPLPPTWSDLGQAFGRVVADGRWTLSLWRRVWAWVVVVATSAVLVWQGQSTFELPLLLAIGLGVAVGLLGVPLLLYAGRYLGRIVVMTLGAVLRSGHEATKGGVNALREGYVRALNGALNHSTAVLVGAALLFGTLFYVFPQIEFNFVPQVDAGQIDISLELPPGSTLGRTDEVTRLVEAELSRISEIATVQATVGSGGLLGTSNAEEAGIIAELTGLSERDISSFELAEMLQTQLNATLVNYPEVELEVVSGDGGAVPVETGLALTLSSTDLDLLRERDAEARELLEQNPYLRNVSSSLEGTVSERVFVIDRSRLAGTGLTPNDVAQALRAYNVGIRAANLRQGGDEIPILVKVDPVFIRDEQTLLSLSIFAPALQGYLPLGQLGTFVVQAAPTNLNRTNQAYATDISADLAPNSPGLLRVRTEVEEALRANGIVDQQVQQGQGVGPDLLGDLVFYGPIAFALALVLNYMVIASQFNSFRYPFYLLLTVPLALVGAFWLFFLTGNSLDVISVLGVVVLIGLVTKNAILLLDVVVGQFKEGQTLRDALIEAGRLRLRPILMTALTVVIISIPLLAGLGEGSEFRRPLGLVIVGGVVSSTFLTLFVVPSAFYRFEKHRYAEEVAAEKERGLGPRLRPGGSAAD